MGIDVYLEWDGMTEDDKQKQYTGMSIEAGNVGYLREAYHGGPYATKLLCREAFESENCRAEIPAAIMRERLTHVTEPARNCDGGHETAEIMLQMLTMLMPNETVTLPAARIQNGRTTPMTVEEAVRERHKNVYPEDDADTVDRAVKSYIEFVELAEQKEAELGKPCTIFASY